MQAFRALQMLIMSVLATSVDDKHRNPMWPAMGYPGKQYKVHAVFTGLTWRSNM